MDKKILSISDAASILGNPHFPALRSDPMALSGASRRKQIPSSKRHAETFKETLAQEDAIPEIPQTL
jgi:hypothetical protein